MDDLQDPTKPSTQTPAQTFEEIDRSSKPTNLEEKIKREADHVLEDLKDAANASVDVIKVVLKEAETASKPAFAALVGDKEKRKKLSHEIRHFGKEKKK